MSQKNLDTLARIYEGWEQGDFRVGVALFDESATLVIDRDIPDRGTYVGPGGIKTYMKHFLADWDSLSIAAESFKDAGDTILVKVKQEGIGHQSGVPASTVYFQVWTFRGSKVIRLDSILNEPEALEAAGLSE